jgi:hypothetical protein
MSDNNDTVKVSYSKKFSEWLDKHENAQRLWELLGRTARYGILLGIGSSALWVLYNILASLFNRALLNPQEVISWWVAEVPLAVLLRYIFGESIPDRPDLRIRGKEVTSDRCFCAVVTNRGRSTAEVCRARLAITDWHDNDLLENKSGELEKAGYHRTLTFKLKWPTEPPELRPDDDDVKIEMFRIRSDEKGIEFMEFPKDNGWDQIAAKLAITKSSYTGTITVGAKNTRPAIGHFNISRATGSKPSHSVFFHFY